MLYVYYTTSFLFVKCFWQNWSKLVKTHMYPHARIRFLYQFSIKIVSLPPTVWNSGRLDHTITYFLSVFVCKNSSRSICDTKFNALSVEKLWLIPLDQSVRQSFPKAYLEPVV